LILELLKARTRSHHERAEAALPLMDDGLTLDRYRETLAAFLGVYLPLEERLAAQHAWHALGFDFERRRKAGLIDRDLLALGLSASDIALVPLCPDLPPVDTLPRALGALYVMEGATLGGQVIRRRLERALGLDATDGVAFFSSYGEGVGSMWREFQDLVRRSIATHDELDAMVDTAAATFDTLTGWIARAPVHDDA
jgi:heme oxygenase